jgi:hypothetical protein
VDAEESPRVTSCNCSICRRSGFLHLIVPASRFRLVAGEDALQSYRFNTRTANHLYCSHCGIKSFYVPRSHPGGYSVNARCLEPTTVASLVIEQQFDGMNWEQHIHELPPLET